MKLVQARFIHAPLASAGTAFASFSLIAGAGGLAGVAEPASGACRCLLKECLSQ